MKRSSPTAALLALSISIGILAAGTSLVAFADPVVQAPPIGENGIATSPGPVLDAAMVAIDRGDILGTVVLLVVVVVAVARAAVGPLRRSKLASWLTNLALSFGGVVALAVAAGQPISLGVLIGAAVTALAAAGTWQAYKDGREAIAPATNVEIARKMYVAYTAHSGGLNYRGEPCPTWDRLPPEIRGHWSVAAAVARGGPTA